jgi:HD-like signal output (HDOD) protein
MGNSLQDLIASTNELAALPTTTVRLLELLDDTTVEANRVLAVIEKDPALTANLLKLCNSAYYGMRRQVGSVKESLVLLGNKTVVTLAFATSMGDVLRGRLSAYGLGKDEMWHHALATALGASHVMVALDEADLKERAFTAGLVHDIGKLLLNRPLKNQLQQLPPGIAGLELMMAERDILGFDHSEAGAALATAWNFPPLLAAGILYHHRPAAAEDNSSLLRAVFAANLVAESLGIGGRVDVPEGPDLMALLAGEDVPAEAVVHLTQNLAKDLDDLLAVVGQPV